MANALKPTLIDTIGSIGKTNPRILYASPYLLHATTVPSSLMQTGLWSRCNEAQNCVDKSTKLPCCRVRRCIERNIESLMPVALSLYYCIAKSEPSKCIHRLFSITFSLSSSVCVSNCIFFFNPASALMCNDFHLLYAK